MSWRVARSLDTLLGQINALAPHRSKASDGSIGDAAHASRNSDHNPWVLEGSVGIVTARDFTHDPAGGFDAYKFAEILKAHKDQRIKYVISNRKIWNPNIGSDWRPYNGVNPHNHHTHVSVLPNKTFYDSTAPWDLTGLQIAPAAIPIIKPEKPILRNGDKGSDVEALQRSLNKHDFNLNLDGQFGTRTEDAVKSFQKSHGLVVDGVVGFYTWKALDMNDDYSDPQTSISYLMKLGWSEIAATVLVANLMWESGGNSKWTIVWDARGDKDADGKYRSHGAAQWNDRHGRFQGLEGYAQTLGKMWTYPEAQLKYLNYELITSEARAGKMLKASATLEEAMEAALTFWRPSIPHADKRLAIAAKLYEANHVGKVDSTVPAA